MSKSVNPKKSFFAKRIPTLVGLGVLVVALIAGTLLFGQGTGVFAPRATPQTTPKKIRVTNLTDSGFTVSFLTDESTVGHVKYGTDPKKISSQASDDRDQLSGTVGKYNIHHITIRGLEPNSLYYYNLGTGSGGFDNNGQPFSIKTTQRSGVPSAAKTVYGSVVSPSGSPAEGVVVYVKAEGVGEMSSLVKSSGSWAIPLSNARVVDGSTYAQITDENVLTLFVQGKSSSLTSQITTTVVDAQPVSNITLGQSQNLAQEDYSGSQGVGGDNPSNIESPEATDNLNLIETPEATNDNPDLIGPPETVGGLDNILGGGNSEESSASSQFSYSPEATGEASVVETVALVDLEAIEGASGSSAPTVDTTQPKITGKAAPNATISIQVNSDTQIDQYIVADGEGNFELDISQLEQELEPGEHSVTYSYEDPATGQTVTKTQTFYVSESASQLAQADTGGTQEYPYSSSSPFPIATESTEATESAEATQSAEATESASTESAIPVSGSVGTTYALIFGGLFFILAGVWSWWIANNLEEELVV